jgi:hypothetical protein
MAQPSDPTPPTPPGSTESIVSRGSIREIINEIHHLLIELSKRLDAIESREERRPPRKRKRE